MNNLSERRQSQKNICMPRLSYRNRLVISGGRRSCGEIGITVMGEVMGGVVRCSKIRFKN